MFHGGGPLIAWFTDPAGNVLWPSRRDGTLGRDRETVRSRGRRATRLLAHGVAKAISRSIAMMSIRSATVCSNHGIDRRHAGTPAVAHQVVVEFANGRQPGLVVVGRPVAGREPRLEPASVVIAIGHGEYVLEVRPVPSPGTSTSPGTMCTPFRSS